MSDELKPEKPEMTPYQILMREIAIGVLVVGLSVSAVVFATAAPEVENDYFGVYVTSIHNSKRQLLELERIGGKAAVVAVELSDWFDGLWHGRRLAGTLAVLSVAASLLCFLAGKIPPLDE
ncbi:MAG: hypothetical protein M0P95_15630 [Sulfuritalea sp.]|jgi:hypothetical protein|nr:hypothetical protein [Sulfuritalea sp.]